MQNRSYQWFVVRGRIGISIDSTHLNIAFDAEGAASCIMSEQDATEIAGLVAEQAKILWDASDKSPEPTVEIQGDVHSDCELRYASGALRIVIHDTKPLIAVFSEGAGICKFSISEAVALVQILKYMCISISERNGTDLA
jgi:hypothetical protein